MSFAGMMIQNAKVVPALEPQTMAGADTGPWVSMKGYDRIGILVYIAQGAVNTTAITVDRATNVSGADIDTGITLNHWWHITDTATGASDTWVKGVAAAAITSSATGTDASMYYIEVDADDLVTGVSAFGPKYDCVRLAVGASNVGNILAAVYVMHPSRYAQAVSPTPSALID